MIKIVSTKQFSQQENNFLFNQQLFLVFAVIAVAAAQYIHYPTVLDDPFYRTIVPSYTPFPYAYASYLYK